MSRKGNAIYEVVSALTLALPLPIYLFLSATLFNIVPDYTIYTTLENVVVEVIDETYFLYTTNNASIHAHVTYNNGRYGVLVEETDIIKIDKNYYSYVEKDGVRQLVDIKKFEIQKQQSWKIPLTFFISLFGGLIVTLIITGEMQLQKKYPRIAVLIALLAGTITLYILNTVIGNILGVFVVATISWSVYLLEYSVVQGKISKEQAKKTESELVQALREAIK